MKTEDEVLHLIDGWIHQCITFIQNGGRGEVGKKIKTSDKNDIDARVGEKCPTCPNVMIERKRGKPDGRPKTITAEHIVPRTLGGNNVRDNLVAMCHDCNKCRNTTMTRLLPDHTFFHGRVLNPKEKALIAIFIEWSIRTIHTPNSPKVNPLCTQLFDEAKLEASATREEKMSLRVARKAALSKASNKISKTILSKSKYDSSSEILSLLKEILETQKAILEQLQKSPLRRFRDWIVGLFPKRKPNPSIKEKGKRRSTRSRHISKKNEVKVISEKITSGPVHEYFCPTCATLFKKWKEARLHKEKTGHGCRHCKDCGEYFLREKLRKVHEDQTGHTNYSGQFHAKNRMSIKHYLPEERLLAVNKLQKNEIDVEGISKIIEELIGEDEVTGVVIGNRVRRYQKENDWPTLGSRAFLGAFGIPSNTGLVNAIVSTMGDRVTVIGEGLATRRIKISAKEKSLRTEPFSTLSDQNNSTTVEQEETQQPKIAWFNTSRKGLRLPATPHQMADVLAWFCSNYREYHTHTNMCNALKATEIIPASRAVHTLRAIYRSLDESGTLEWPISIDISLQNPLSLIDIMEKNCIGKGSYGLPEGLAPDYIDRVKDYFIAVRCLSGNNGDVSPVISEEE